MPPSAPHNPTPAGRSAGWVLALAALALPSAAGAQQFQSEVIEGGIVFNFGPSYNRINGLPISIGPVLRTRNEHPLRFSGIVVVRAEDDLPADLDQIGFEINLDKAFGDHVVAGVSGWSRVASIEDRGLSELESSVSAFGFHDDRRDYYDALGVGVFGQLRFDNGIRGFLTFRHERHRPMNTGGVSSLFNSGDPWRSQPLAADGDLRSMIAGVSYDTRPRERDGPFNGWWVSAAWLQGLGGTLTYLPFTDILGNPLVNVLAPDRDFSAAVIDARRYIAIGDVEVNLRATGGGAISDRPLPTQFQTALGGTGSLPGTPLFALDCGARTGEIVPTRPSFGREPFYPYYGCDRFVHVQIEVAGYFGFAIGRGEQRRNPWRGPGGMNLRLVPQWVVFANGAQGWSHLEGFYPGVRDEDFVYDAGAGIVFGNVGGYVAYPLNTPEKKLRVAIRLERRF